MDPGGRKALSGGARVPDSQGVSSWVASVWKKTGQNPAVFSFEERRYVHRIKSIGQGGDRAVPVRRIPLVEVSPMRQFALFLLVTAMVTCVFSVQCLEGA